VIAELAVARIRLGNALGRLFVVAGRNRAGQVNVAVRYGDRNVSVGKSRFIVKRILDLRL